MKKHFILAAMAVTALFSACNNEDSTPLNEGTVPVSFTIGGIGSRVATTFGPTGTITSFADNDAVGIFSAGLGTTEMENVKYTYTTADGLTTTGTYNFPDNGSDVTFKAYYPYTTNITGKVINCSVQVDQTEINNFNNSDFIYATGSGNATDSEVTLAFNHQMALVEVELGTGFTGALNTSETITTVGINVIKDATFNLDADASAMISTTSTRENILMYKDNTTSKYYAIVPAQTITGDGTTALFTITTNERAFSYKPSASSTEEFQAGKTTKIKLNVTGGTQELAVFKVSSVTINNWDTDRPDEIIQKEYGVTEDENIIAITIPETWPTTVGTDQTKVNTTTPWGINGATAAIENSAIKFISSTNTANNFNYWNNMLFVYIGQLNLSKTYKVTINAKAEEESVNLRTFVLSTVKDGTSSLLCKLTQYDTQNVATTKSGIFKALGTEASDYIFYITPSEFSKNLTTSFSTYTPTVTPGNEFVLAFSPNVTKDNTTSQGVGTGTYYINSITIEEQ